MNLRLPGTLALFSEEIPSPNFTASETSNKVLSEYQAAHLKLGYTNRQLLFKALCQIFISFSPRENLRIHS